MIRLTEGQTADFFARSCATIGQATDKIIISYPEATFNLIECATDSVLEITTEHFTLSCLLDTQNRCERAYIFINKEDELDAVMHIMRHCTKSYLYSYLLKMWVNDGLGIDLQVMEQSVLFSISRIMPLPDDLQKCLDVEFGRHLN